MTKQKAFIQVALSILTGLVGGLATNFFTDTFTLIHLIAIAVCGAIIFFIVQKDDNE